MTLKFALQLFTALALLALGGCGSESSEQALPEAKEVLLTASQASDIGVQVSAAQDTILSVPSTSSVGASMAPGKTLLLPPGTDSRFPLGFAAKVSSVENRPDGSKLVTLAPTTLADAVQSSKISRPAVALGAENFVGVLSPAAVKPAPGAKVNASQLRGDVLALGGALVVRPANPNILRRALSSVLPGGGTIGAASIELNAELQLAEIVDNPSLLKPYGSGANAKIALSIKLDNLKLTENHDFGNSIAGLGLKSLELHVEGDLSAEFKFVGGAEARLGFFSRAWREVEEQSGSLFGVSAKLTGLDSKDKVGKFPLAGLVFSVPCAANGSCPIETGNTQTPLRLAKAGGVIVWLYLMADGTIKVDGTVGLARVNDLHVLFGMQKPEGGKLDKVASFSHSSVGNVVDAPYYEGTVDVTARTGVAIDVDFFALGIRVANTSAAVLSQATLSLTGSVAHSWPAFTSPWVWTGSACARAQVGAGLMVAAGFNLGVEVDTWLGKVGSARAYSGQWPSDDEIATPGWHGIPLGSFGTWYSATPMTACWPAPVASNVAATVAGNIVTIAVSGTNLPDDLTLNLTNTGSCTGLHLLASGGNLVTYACTLPPGGTGALNYQLTSTKAGNLDTGALNGSIALAPVISGDPQGVSVSVGQSATFQVTAIGSTPLTYQWRRDAVAIPNATSPTYTIASATSADSGARFSVVVSNLVGSRTSASALLTVTAARPGPSQGRLNDTGITASECYAADSAGLVSCTSAEALALYDQQDGMIGRDVTNNDDSDGKAGFSFSLVPKSTGGFHGKTECVKDNVTGLIWEGKTGSGERSALNIYDNKFVFGPRAYMAYVNSIALCGFSNWRMPNRLELQGIVNYGGGGQLAIDAGWFPNTASDIGYWSSDRVDNENAWIVDFVDGDFRIDYDYTHYHVRLVR